MFDEHLFYENIKPIYTSIINKKVNFKIFVGCRVPIKKKKTTRLVVVASTNESLYNIYIPSGDIFIHLNERIPCDEFSLEIIDNIMKQQPHKYKILIAGKHSNRNFIELFETHNTSETYCLNGNFTTINGINIYCASKLNKLTGELEINYQSLPPLYIDIIISHVAPLYILDTDRDDFHNGDIMLNELIEQCKPPLCIFAGPAESHGMLKIDETVYINASQFSEYDDSIKYGLPISIDYITCSLRRRKY